MVHLDKKAYLHMMQRALKLMHASHTFSASKTVRVVNMVTPVQLSHMIDRIELRYLLYTAR